jgi:type II secretory pathway pseudopilin PulG
MRARGGFTLIQLLMVLTRFATSAPGALPRLRTAKN